MSFISKLIVFTIVMVFVGCAEPEDCPPDQELDTIRPSLESSPFQPYNGYEVLIFSDSLGNEKTLNGLGVRNSSDRLVVEETCNDFLFSQTNTQIYYNSIEEILDFSSPSDENMHSEIFLELYLHTELYAPGLNAADHPLFDIFSFVGSFAEGEEGWTVRFQIVTSLRDNEALIPTSAVAGYESYEFFENTTLLGKQFQNVYRSGDDQYDFFFVPSQGIVAFINKGQLFVLE